ncbi:MAG: hypothetical protein ACYC55_04405 [Candidatus Geothermincolia bacterium]
MEPADFQRQVLTGMRSYMRASFEAMNMVQEQFEKMMTLMLEQHLAGNREAQKITYEWLDSFRKGREEFRRNIEEGLTRVEETFAHMPQM